MGSESTRGIRRHILPFFCFLASLFAVLGSSPLAAQAENEKIVQIEYAYTTQASASFNGFVNTDDENSFVIRNSSNNIQHRSSTPVIISQDSVAGSGRKAVSYDLAPGAYSYEVTLKNFSQPAKGYFVVDDTTGDPESEFDQRIVLIQQKFTLNPEPKTFELRDFNDNTLVPFNIYDSKNYYFLLVCQIGKAKAYKYSATPVDTSRKSASGTYFYEEEPSLKFKYTSIPNKGVIFELPVSTTTIKVPKGADMHIYQKEGIHYVPFIEHELGVKNTENPDYDAFLFYDLPIGPKFHLEASGGGYVRTASTFSFDSNVQGNFTISMDLAELDPENSVRPYVIKEGSLSGAYHDDLYMNTDDSRAIYLQGGDVFNLFPLRVFQAQTDAAGNYFLEPDYHFELINPSTGETQPLDSLTAEKGEEVTNGSVSLTPLGKRGRETYQIKGVSNGLALIKITYDPIIWSGVGGMSVGYDGANFLHIQEGDPNDHYLNPIEDRNTVVIPVTVGGADNSGINHGIEYRGEYDTIYFERENGSTDYTFKPTATGGGIMSVRVRKPLHNVEGNWEEAWESDWSDGVKNEDGSYTITLYDGRNIVEIKAGEAVKYYVLDARAIDIVITNQNNPEWKRGQPVAVGDTLTIEWPGQSLKTPVQKLAKIYNPQLVAGGFSTSDGGVWVRYFERYAGDDNEDDDQVVKSSRAQYTIRSAKIEYIPSRGGAVTLSGGQIYNSWYGQPLDTHRNIVDNGMEEDVSSDDPSYEHWFCRMPDITFEVIGEGTGDGDGDPDTGDPDDTENTVTQAVAVGTQSGTLEYGTAGNASFSVTVTGIDDAIYSVTLTGAPQGVTVPSGNVTISDGKGTLTLSTSAATPAGNYSITLKLGDVSVTSPQFTLSVAERDAGGNGNENVNNSNSNNSNNNNDEYGSGTSGEGEYVVDKTTDPANPAVKVQADTTLAKETGTTTTTAAKGSLSGAIDKAVTEAKNAGSKEPTVTIPAKAAEGGSVKAAIVELPVDDLKDVADSGENVSVKIESSVGEVKLNNEAVKDLVTDAAGAEYVKAVIERKDDAAADGALTAGQKAAAGGEDVRAVYDISLYADDTPLAFATSTDDGKLTIGLPYALKEGEVAAGVKVVYLPEGGGQLPTEDNKYEKGLAKFRTSHLSVYAVTYAQRNTENAENTENAGDQNAWKQTGDTGSSGGCETGSFGAIGLAALLALAFAIARGRKAA